MLKDNVDYSTFSEGGKHYAQVLSMPSETQLLLRTFPTIGAARAALAGYKARHASFVQLATTKEEEAKQADAELA